MKTLYEFINEASTSAWLIYGTIQKTNLKKFQNKLNKFEIIRNYSNYDGVDEPDKILIDVAINSSHSKVERFANRFFLSYTGYDNKDDKCSKFMSGGKILGNEQYDRFINQYNKYRNVK